MDESTRIIRSLRNPSLWPDAPGHVDLIETHISWVLVTREFAWKIRKPVSFGFIDFSTLELRLRYAEEELRLNRRTSPHLYLGIVPITGTRNAPVIGGEGPVIEYAVQMRRFEQDQLLLRVADAGAIGSDAIIRLAETLAAMHQHVETAHGSSCFGTLEAVSHDALDNFNALASLLPSDDPDMPVLKKLQAWTVAELERLAPVIEQRHQSGMVRECHGDLHLGNIVMIDDRPTLFDCLEFNEQFRWIDVMNEIAFLIMDLEEHRQHSGSRILLNRYLEITGDYHGLKLLQFYIVYRAMVRAKVDLLRCRQSEDEVMSRRMTLESSDYLHLAARNAIRSQPILIIMHGVSGSGKSYVSSRLLAKAPCVRIRSDIERKRLSGLGETQRSDGEVNRQLYSVSRSAQTYQRLLNLAELILDAGHSVVVDAVFMSHEHREPFQQLAERLGAPFLILACEAPADILRSRVYARQAANLDPSDADVSVLEKQLSVNRDLELECESHLIRINTASESAIDDALRNVCQLLG
ncbi:MAG: AAA family ATPase [Planctomycetota bacterium]